jgi:hypothetical protein
MPMLVAFVADLNVKFHASQIANTAKQREAFAPGRPLDLGVLADGDRTKQRVLALQAKALPPMIQEALRSVIYHALGEATPRPITFAWAPAYDYELSIFDAPCGTTVLLKSRYAADAPPNRGDPSI